MIYLMVHRAWTDEEDTEIVEVELMQTYNFFSVSRSPRATLWVESPVAHLQIGDKLIRLTEMVYVDKKSFVIFQHETSKRIFSLTSRELPDMVDDGLLDITCNS